MSSSTFLHCFQWNFIYSKRMLSITYSSFSFKNQQTICIIDDDEFLYKSDIWFYERKRILNFVFRNWNNLIFDYLLIVKVFQTISSRNIRVIWIFLRKNPLTEEEFSNIQRSMENWKFVNCSLSSRLVDRRVSILAGVCLRQVQHIIGSFSRFDSV